MDYRSNGNVCAFCGFNSIWWSLVLSQETNVIETIHLVSLGNTEKINGTIHQGLLSSTTTVNKKTIYRFIYKKDGGLVAIGEIDATTPVKEINDGKLLKRNGDNHLYFTRFYCPRLQD